MIAAGAHPKYIQGQLGHASIQVTMTCKLVNALDDAATRNPGATGAAGRNAND
jgi:hypothetical protein